MHSYIKIIGYLISAVLLYVTFRGTDYKLVFHELKHFNIYCLAGALISNICFFVIRGFYQISNLRYIKPNITFSTSIMSIGIAQSYNAILPARLGDALRALFLAKREGMHQASILSYIFIEKVLDFLVILFLLSMIVIFGLKNVELQKTLMFSFIAMISVLIGLFIYVRFNMNLVAIFRCFMPINMYKSFTTINIALLQGIKFYRSINQAMRSTFLLTTSWLMIMGVFWFISYPYVRLLELPFYSFLVFMVFSAISLSVPCAPAGIGVMHYGFFLAFKLLADGKIGTQVNTIAAGVIFMHIFSIFLDVLAGMLIIVYYKLKNKEKLVFYKRISKEEYGSYE